MLYQKHDNFRALRVAREALRCEKLQIRVFYVLIKRVNYFNKDRYGVHFNFPVSQSPCLRNECFAQL